MAEHNKKLGGLKPSMSTSSGRGWWPPYVLDALQKRGHGNAKILRMSARDAFVEWCAWNGNPNGDQIWSTMKELQRREKARQK